MLVAALAWLAACAAAAAAARGCALRPEGAAEKAPGDNYYRLIVNGEVERYAPGARYVVTLVGARTHDVVQQFTRFQLVLDPLDPAAPRTPSRQGQFQLFADTLTRFHDACANSVVEADDLPKTEVQVMWKAPPSGSGCVLIKAMVYENSSRWFAEDGQLTKRICEDTSINAPDCCACDDAKYKMVFEGLWSPQTHPKNFPKEALWLTHFSDIIGATHPKNFSFWGEGQIASDGFRSLAEWGSVGLMERELRQQGRLLRSIVKAQGLWHPRVNSNTSATFAVDRRRSFLSLASMFGPSPDWVVGISSLNLCLKDCTWEEAKVIDLYPYDAGTDNGISYMSPNAETSPRERMYRITTMYPEDPRAPFYNPGGQIAPMARLYLTREKLVPRACDEEVLQSLVTDDAEDTHSADRPECAVGEWGAWSACSVSCGKGLRMRARQYRLPQKAQMLACDRQLQAKEMCVAAVPECEGASPVEEPEESDLTPVEEGGVCATSEWTLWGECSVTCGVGVETRRRRFLQPMGFKKCPLVPTEENRKCMQPQCLEEEREEEDPACPASEWSGWSPCSASCGPGVALRTRLLLVPAERQRACAARVELVRQRRCLERADCSLDAPAAKRECPMLPVPAERQRACAARVELVRQRRCLERADCSLDAPAAKRECPMLPVPAERQRACAARVELVRQRRCLERADCSLDAPAAKRECPMLPVPAERQRACAARVELVRQRRCLERADCSLDAPAAKRICMEEPEVGPCRGAYQRWAFAAAKGMCVPFTYGGCRGSRNNFLTADECRAACSVLIGGTNPQANQLPAANNETVSNNVNGGEGAAGECQLSAWSEWSRCSVSCGAGYQERTRTVIRQAAPGAPPCPARLARRRRCSRPC